MPKGKAGLYCRLSVEDDEKRTGTDSGSISNQKMLLTQYCKDHGFDIYEYYIDDGISGTTFERPGYQRMMADIEAGKIDTVICKDLSRLGRTYSIWPLLEEYFPDKGIRFIAVSDNVDSECGEYGISVAIRNLINAEQPKDTSKKVKMTKLGLARQGIFLGSKAPLGYMKDPDKKGHLIIDDEASRIVRRIFDLSLSGYGINSIARKLRNENIVTPAEYARQHNMPNCSRTPYAPGREYAWNPTSVAAILMNPAYKGSTVQSRRGNVRVRGKQKKKKREDWIEVNGTHEPIVSEDEWEQVQRQLSVRRRASENGSPQMFAGLLYCANCGAALSFSKIPRKTLPDTGKYRCWQSLRYGPAFCPPHTIYLHQLTDAVLRDIREVAAFSLESRQELIELLRADIESRNAADGQTKKAAYDRNIARREEILRCEKALFEKNALGIVDNEQYIRFNSEYRQERELLDKQIAEFESEQAAAKNTGLDPEKFTELISKYADIQQLDARILNTLIEKILVHEKVDGVQKIEIFYKFTGKLPD